MTTAANALRDFLSVLAPGPVADVYTAERLLADAWHALDGSGDGGMAAYKLLDRTEHMTWDPPVLAFQLERHGGVVGGGGITASLQRWRVDVTRSTATLDDREGRRLVAPRAPSIALRPIVERISAAIVQRIPDPAIFWLPSGSVQVQNRWCPQAAIIERP